MGSGPNNWRDKREEQHNAHNRKAGAAAFLKQKRNRHNRRRDKRIQNWRTEGKIPTKFDNRSKLHKEDKKFRPRPKPIVTIEETLSEEILEKLRDIK